MKKRILKIDKNLEGSSAFLISPRSFNSCSLYVPIDHHPGLSYETIFRNMQKTALCNKRRFRCRSVYSLLASSLVISSQVTPFSTISTMA